MSDHVKVIGGPMDGHVVGWRRSVVMVRRDVSHLVNPLSKPSEWRSDDEPRKEETFTYARFSRPSGSFYAPHDWTWEKIEQALLNGYKGTWATRNP